MNLEKNPLIQVSYQTPLLDVMKHFAKGVHRLAVEQDSRIVNIISQMDVLQFLSSVSSSFEPVISKQLGEIGLSALGLMKKTWLFNEKMRVLDVLKCMKEENISGGAVIDHTGKIVWNFSASDLVVLNETNFAWITLPVREFLHRIHNGILKTPITCRVNDELELVLLKLKAHKVYRIHLVNEYMRPIGVLTLTDIIRFFLPESATEVLQPPLKESTEMTEVCSVYMK